MTNDPNVPQPRFEHVHVCIHCGAAFRREEFSGRAITSGIYTCPKCGLDGPLNVEVREVGEHYKAKDHSPKTNSSGQG
jgi:predicted RNA-binding Zn-ribbon protein involved in translation (DUF1610 family)